jgi:hypothetical protein
MKALTNGLGIEVSSLQGREIRQAMGVIEKEQTSKDEQ